MKKEKVSQVWWPTSEISALRGWRQEDEKVKTSLGYIARLRKQKQNKTPERKKQKQKKTKVEDVGAAQ
jgi:hypothetical protein